MSTIYLVRHGQAAFGSDDYDQLSDIGRRQSEAVATHWLSLGYRLDSVYSGAMARQRDSADIVLARYQANGHSPSELRVLENFNEYSFQPILRVHADQLAEESSDKQFDWNHAWSDKRAFNEFLRSALERWSQGGLSVAGVESWSAFKQRCVNGLQRIMEEGGRGKAIAVFSSAGAISAAVQHVLELNDDQTIRLMLGLYNTSVTTLFYDDDTVSLSSYNSVAHLENEAHKALITYR